METRPLGRTGLRVTRMGLGLAALGRPGYITLGHAVDFGPDHRWDTVRTRTEAVLDAALAAGIAHFDAARSYGRAEELLAGWLDRRAIAQGAVTVSSKWGYTYTAGWRVDASEHEIKSHTLATLDRQRPETLAHLGRWLGLYQVHSATLESGVLTDSAVLDGLAQLRAEGIAVGLTVSGPMQGETILRALAIERHGSPLFDSVQATWNVLEPSAGEALAQAHADGRGVIIKEALANGRLTDRDPALGPRARAALMAAVPDASGADQAALAVALALPYADVVLSGAATVDQVRSNVAAVGLTADTDAVDGLREDADSYWTARGARAWT